MGERAQTKFLQNTPAQQVSIASHSSGSKSQQNWRPCRGGGGQEPCLLLMNGSKISAESEVQFERLRFKYVFWEMIASEQIQVIFFRFEQDIRHGSRFKIYRQLFTCQTQDEGVSTIDKVQFQFGNNSFVKVQTFLWHLRLFRGMPIKKPLWQVNKCSTSSLISSKGGLTGSIC